MFRKSAHWGKNRIKVMFRKSALVGGIPYIAHGAQLPPPSYFFFLFFSCFYAYSRLGQVKLWLGLPYRVRKEVWLGPCRDRAPRRGKIQIKIEKSKIRGGGLFVLQQQNTGWSPLVFWFIKHIISPSVLVLCTLWLPLDI